MPRLRPLWLATTLLLVSAGASAQERSPDGRGGEVSRARLQEILAEHEQAARSGRKGDVQRRARMEAEIIHIRRRLQEGDLQVGDRIILSVEGHPQLSDTFTVATGRVLELPLIGEVPLAGLLRSELEPSLTRHLGRFIRDPQVRARPTLRVTVVGEVGRPGYYVTSTESLVTDVLMLAGGPTPRAKLEGMRIERGGEAIWRGEELQRAITQGQTLDQMSLLAGDRIYVPSSQSSFTRTAVRVVPFVVATVLGVLRLID